MEDGGTNIGLLTSAAEDLGRLLLREFVLIYGNDWFQFPLVAPVGSQVLITSLSVADTFGIATAVPHYSKIDGAFVHADSSQWPVALILGACVFSHWSLDVPMHTPDMPLAGDVAAVRLRDGGPRQLRQIRAFAIWLLIPVRDRESGVGALFHVLTLKEPRRNCQMAHDQRQFCNFETERKKLAPAAVS